MLTQNARSLYPERTIATFIQAPVLYILGLRGYKCSGHSCSAARPVYVPMHLSCILVKARSKLDSPVDILWSDARCASQTDRPIHHLFHQSADLDRSLELRVRAPSRCPGAKWNGRTQKRVHGTGVRRARHRSVREHSRNSIWPADSWPCPMRRPSILGTSGGLSLWFYRHSFRLGPVSKVVRADLNRHPFRHSRYLDTFGA